MTKAPTGKKDLTTIKGQQGFELYVYYVSP